MDDRDQSLKQQTPVIYNVHFKNFEHHCIILFLYFLHVFLFHCFLQVEHEDIQLSVSGVTSDSTGTDGRLWDAADSEDPPPEVDTPSLISEDLHPRSSLFSLTSSPADQALSRLTHPTFSESNNQKECLPVDTCDLR